MTAEAALTMDDRDAFAALLQAHRGIVHKVAAAYARHPDDRAELAQEIAAQLWSAWRGYDRSRLFSTWMYRVALNTAMTAARDRRMRQSHVGELDDAVLEHVGAAAPDSDAALLLAQVMESLDAPSRALLLLHLEARSTLEIADVLGLSATAVTTRIHRIRQRLRDRFAPETGANP
ncbi:RNA polymerase sigma factor [Lysobacter humi (ex Lee et al. 2017)]